VPIESEEQVRGSKHFAELMADKAINWMRTQNSLAPNKHGCSILPPGSQRWTGSARSDAAIGP
jgi:hypothetical protein